MASTPSTTGNTSPSIQVSKSEVLVDEKVRITIDGLHSNQKVSLLSTLEENKKIFTSCGHYIADDQGQVDTFVHHSHGGSFTGVQPMGLFTSTKELYGSSRLMKLDVTTPYDVTLSVHDGHLDFEPLAREYVESRAFPLAVTSLKRWYMAPDVRRILVHEGRMYGALFLPPGDGPFPGIVDIFGMSGGLKDFRAALLASHGFAAFSLAYIAYKDLPTRPEGIEKTYFLEAIDWLRRHPMVQQGGVGMVGNCIGGNFCLTTAALSPEDITAKNNEFSDEWSTIVVQGSRTFNDHLSEVRVVVSTNANPVLLFEGTHRFGDVTVKSFRFDPSRGTVTKDGVMWKDMFKGVVVTDHFIPIWKRNVKALIVVGEADLCNNVKVQREFEAAIPSDRKHNIRFVYYPGAGHLIEPPYSPHCLSSYNKFYSVVELWGGDPEYHLRAQEDAWPKIITFLKTHLAMKSLL